MSCKVRKIVAVVVAVLFVIMEPAVFAGSEALAVFGSNVYAAVGSIADGEDITYDKNGGVLARMGFDRLWIVPTRPVLSSATRRI